MTLQLRSLDMAEELLRAGVVPREVPRRIADAFPRLRHITEASLGDIDVRNLLPVLEQLWPIPWGAGQQKNVLYVVYLAMKAYSECNMRGRASEEALSSVISACARMSQTDLTKASAALPIAPELQEDLWLFLAGWREQFSEPVAHAIGDYLIAVHVDHARKFAWFFRSQFVMACVWTGNAWWAEPHMQLYRALPGPAHDLVTEAVSAAREHDLSAIRLLADPDYAHSRGLTGPLRWYREPMYCEEPCEPPPEADAIPCMFDQNLPGPADRLLDEEKERTLNDSLERVFAQDRHTHDSL